MASGRSTGAAAPLVVCFASLAATPVLAHTGPPYPIVSDRTAGPYIVGIWADPDTTDDGSAAGKFWLMLEPAEAGAPLPATTRAHVSITPTDRPGPPLSGAAELVDGDVARQFVALEMNHEGPFDVVVAIEGPRGAVTVESSVEATYDLRPPPILVVVYVLPFLLAGLLWGKLLLKRRAAALAPAPGSPVDDFGISSGS